MSDFQEQAAFWHAAIELQQHSGQSIRQFCQVEGLKEPVFYRWRKQLGLRPVDLASVKSESLHVCKPSQISIPPSSFVPLHVHPSPPEVSPEHCSSHCIEIRLPNGITLIISGAREGADLPTLLSDLLRAC